MKRIKIVSLFSGIGGFELGLKDLGEVVFSNEIDKWACETYKANFPNIKLVEGDIRNIRAEEIPEHDLLCAGFPCQPFSIARGKENQGLNDPRGNLFKEILRVAKYHKPTWILLENVKGLTNKRNSEAFNLIIKGMEEMGYKVAWKILNAKDYGVPQNRERVFFVANNQGVIFDWPKPNGQPTKISDILTNEVAAKYYLSEKAWEGLKKHKERNKAKGNGYGFTTFEPTDEATNTIRARYYKDGQEILIFQNRRGTLREKEGEISPTLTANMGTGGHNVPFVKKETETPRKLTPRECARLQGFSDDFKIVVSDTQAYKQFGNAVCVPVIKAIAEQIKIWQEK